MSDTLVKKPHKLDKMTNEQMLEFAKCADSDTGYDYFMRNYIYIQHPVFGQLKYDPYDYQVKLVDTYHHNRFSIALMPRQTGKCVVDTTLVKIRNKKTGEIKEITMENFYLMSKKDK